MVEVARVDCSELELVTRDFELVTRGFKLLTRRFELAARKAELVHLNSNFWIPTRAFKLSTLN